MSTYEAVLDALGDPTRRRIIAELRKSGPASVAQVAATLPVSRPAVSQHLRVLRDSGLVDYSEDGTRNVYRLNPDGLDALRRWLDDFWGAAVDSFESYVREHKQEQKQNRRGSR